MASILVVDDEEGIRTFIAEVLEIEEHEVEVANDGQEALEILGGQSFDLVVTDLRMPRVDGLALLRSIRSDLPETEVIVLTAHGSVDNAVEAMKIGAFDYLQKPLQSPAELRMVVARALERSSLLALKARTDLERTPSEGFISADPAMTPIVEAMRKVAGTQATVLLLGESGTGKEVAAQTIHRWSSRADGPFVAINCAALTETLLEGELFGHEKGAFTGATAQRRGRIELASGGTFFLDEVGELQPRLQAKLLRVLQERTFERLGGSRAIRADVRWIAATNRDLRAMVGAGEFREDLYHRLAVFPVQLPPLRERPGDLAPIAEHLLAKIGEDLGRPGLALDQRALAALRGQPWPGNIRQLRNVLERAAILAEGRVLKVEHLFLESVGTQGSAAVQAAAQAAQAAAAPASAVSQSSPGEDVDVGNHTLEELERIAIEQALGAVGGNRRLAAERLGIGLRTLYDKLKRYQLS